jgi:hypothetical protein
VNRTAKMLLILATFAIVLNTAPLLPQVPPPIARAVQAAQVDINSAPSARP